jgi:hypothetical protein
MPLLDSTWSLSSRKTRRRDYAPASERHQQQILGGVSEKIARSAKID